MCPGVSAGIDLSIYFVKKLHGQKVAQEVKKLMEYESNRDFEIPACTCECRALK